MRRKLDKIEESLTQINKTLESNHDDHMCLLMILTGAVMTVVLMLPWL